jgi:polysaccharide biosynthesis/export protein
MILNHSNYQVFNRRFQRFSGLTISLLVIFQGFSPPLLAQEVLQGRNLPSSSNYDRTSTETEYILGPGDQIRISVFNVPEYSGEFLVLVNGVLSVPIIGEIKADGLTVTELTQVLTERYAPYVKRPIITVSLISPRPLRIAVVGEVNRPGTYTINSGAGQAFPTLTDLIKQAGGLTTVAEVRTVQLRRFFQGQQQILTIDLWELLQEGNLAQDVTLRDGDTIIVPTTNTIDLAMNRQLTDANFGIQATRVLNVAIVGEVNRPGSYPIPPDGSGKPPRVSNAIQLAGGIKPLADLRQLEVRRFDRSGAETSFNVDLWDLLTDGELDQDLILQDGDTIIIPTAEAIDPTEAEALASANFSPDTISVSIIGEARGSGRVSLPPNTPLNQALLTVGGFHPTRANQNKVELVRLNPNGTVSKRESK